MISIKRVKKILKKEVRLKKVKITSNEFESGYWLNPINKNWITKRIYISYPEGLDLPKVIKTIDRLNNELVDSKQSNVQILLKE